MMIRLPAHSLAWILRRLSAIRTAKRKEGWEELRALLMLLPEGTVGYGIPSGGGLVSYPDGRVEAIGIPLHCFADQGGAAVRMADLAV